MDYTQLINALTEPQPGAPFSKVNTVLIFSYPSEEGDNVEVVDAPLDLAAGGRILLEDPLDTGKNLVLSFKPGCAEMPPIIRKGGGVTYTFRAASATWEVNGTDQPF